jgi:ketosteroid isomerase-like protein
MHMKKLTPPTRLPGREYPEKGEDQLVALMARDLIAQLEGLYGPGDTQRQAHPKEHGLLMAEFIVEPNLPPELQVGVFALPKTYPAWIRFSSFNTIPQPDIKKDVRGMAIKLAQVPGAKLLSDPTEAETQDFLLVSNETFFAKNLLQFQQLLHAIARGKTGLLRYMLNPFHLPVLIRAKKEFTRPPNLLQIPYWSTTPYQFGDQDRAVKYHVRPQSLVQDSLPRRPLPWYLRQAMIDTLREREVWFDFFVQFQEDPDAMPIEDPSVRWTSPFIKVASIRILRQDFCAEARLTYGQQLSFSPWHSLPAHRPLGALNRARRAIYHAMAEFRLRRNQVTPPKVNPPPVLQTKPNMSNKQIVMEMLQAFQKGDLPTLLGLMAENVVWYTQGDPSAIPFAGAHQGRDGVKNMFILQAQLMKVQNMSIKAIIGGDDEAQQLVLAHESVLVNQTNQTYEMDFALVLTLANGQVANIESLMDTLAVARAFGAVPPAAPSLKGGQVTAGPQTRKKEIVPGPHGDKPL